MKNDKNFNGAHCCGSKTIVRKLTRLAHEA